MTKFVEVDDEMKQFVIDGLQDADGYDGVMALPEYFVQLSENTLTRRTLRKEVSDLSQDLAYWVMIKGKFAFEDFLNDLRVNRVSIRDIDFIKSRVLEELQGLARIMEEAMGRKKIVHVFEGYSGASVKVTGKTVTVTLIE